MRNISSETIAAAVRQLCIDANRIMPEDVAQALVKSREEETWPTAENILGSLLDNIDLAGENNLPVCQDTGMACVFVELGQDVHIEGNFEEAINEGVRRGYCDAFLRKSVVSDPILRGNTNDNTPAVISLHLVPGDKMKITVMPKGFGSENMSALKMLKPSDGVEGVKRFVIDTVINAGANPCPRLLSA